MSWEKVGLPDLCEINVGKTPSRNEPDFFGPGENWVSIADMNGKTFISDTKEQVTIAGVKSANMKLVPANTVLFSFKLSVGKTCITSKPMYTNEAIAALPIRDCTKLDTKFLYYALKSQDFSHLGEKAAKGLTLNKEKLSKIQLAIPPFKVQQKIASVLDQADILRQKDQQLLKKYDELLESVFYKMFGDPVRNENGWEIMQLVQCCKKVTDGTHDTPERLKEGVKFITGKHIRPFKVDYDNSDYVTEEVHKEIYRRCNPEYGDVLYTNIGVNLATAAMNTVEYEFSMKNVALLKPDPQLLIGRFLEHCLNNYHFKSKVVSLTGIGGAQQFLNLKQIKALKIPVPPLSNQEKFARIIEEIERHKSIASIQITNSETLFQSLLQKAFKGELVN